MIPKKLFDQQMALPRTQELFSRTAYEPHVKRLTLSRASAVNLHLQGLSVEHAHSVLDHLNEIRAREDARRREVPEHSAEAHE